MWAQSEMGIADALCSSFAKSLLSCMHSGWCLRRRGKLYVCIALSCFDCIMNKLNKLIKWEKQKWGDDGKGWGDGLTCTFYSKFLLWKIYYIFAWQLQLRASRDVLVAAYVRRTRQWNRLSRSCRHFGLTARTELQKYKLHRWWPSVLLQSCTIAPITFIFSSLSPDVEIKT